MIYIIMGLTGAGKTTYSQRLSLEKSATPFSIDPWMKTLFGGDMPLEPSDQWYRENHLWFMERINRCEAQIWSIVKDIEVNGGSSILDLGFTTSSHRMKFLKLAKENGILAEIHFLDFSAELRWERVQKRNTAKGKSFVMTVSREMFDFMEGIFEPPCEEENPYLRKIGPLL